jgi:hypothetical protein
MEQPAAARGSGRCGLCAKFRKGLQVDSLMDMSQVGRLFAALLTELVNGSPDPAARTYMLNQGDAGLLASLDRLSSVAASASSGGSSIAAHVDHLRYGLSFLNQWATAPSSTWPDADWTLSWRKTIVSEAEWRALRDELRREASDWVEVLRSSRALIDGEAALMAGSVAHLAYHMGAIRQMDRGARGPTAEDEARAQGKFNEPAR